MAVFDHSERIGQLAGEQKNQKTQKMGSEISKRTSLSAFDTADGRMHNSK